MSEESAIAFHRLVSSMRTCEKEFWSTRKRDVLRQSIELEKRVDDTIMKATGNDVPENEDGQFFLKVAELRSTTKQYFAEKRKPSPDQETVNSLFSQVKSLESSIDKALEEWKDAQAIKDGYRIFWHVMERYPSQKEAHSCFSSADKHLAKVQLMDCLRRGGAIYFMNKQYVPLPEKKTDNGNNAK